MIPLRKHNPQLEPTSDLNYSNLTGWQRTNQNALFSILPSYISGYKNPKLPYCLRNGIEYNTLPFPITNPQIATDENRKIRNRGLACTLKLLAQIVSQSVVKPTVWKRYIDDIFSLWDTGKHDRERFILKYINIFKPTETFQYTHFSSSHPPGVKKGFVKGKALRLLRTNSSKTTFEDNIKKKLNYDSLLEATQIMWLKKFYQMSNLQKGHRYWSKKTTPPNKYCLS